MPQAHLEADFKVFLVSISELIRSLTRLQVSAFYLQTV